MKPYSKLLLSLVISFIVMYSVMFLNVDEVSHIYISTNRFYMALLMVLPMAILMMLSMGKMYPNKRLNTAIVSISALLFVVVFLFLRHQAFIGDVQYMRGMISHHSSAIMTSKNATITDPELKQLSGHIIESQKREIDEMKDMLHRMKK